jgi:hypothetical protein
MKSSLTFYACELTSIILVFYFLYLPLSLAPRDRPDSFQPHVRRLTYLAGTTFLSKINLQHHK